MLRRVHVQRVLWPLLAVMLVIAACSNAMACALCPQKARPTSHCAEKAADTAPQHSVNEETAGAFTQQTEQCSHCITHSPGQTNSSSRAVVPSNAAHDSVAAGFSVVVVNVSSSTKPVEIHDHGPPGRTSPRYLLNNSFRI